MNDYTVTINNKKHLVKLYNSNLAEINSKKINVELSVLNNNAYLLKYGNKVFEVTSNQMNKNHFGFLINGWYFDTVVKTRLQETASELLEKKNLTKKVLEIRAPMPGLILKILKSTGEKIKKGEPLLIFEAMKMENELRSIADGMIKDILVKVGETIEKNSLLIIIE